MAKRKMQPVTLPEWAFVEGGEHEKSGNPLYDRNVIIHIRSASIIEFFEEEASFTPAPGFRTYDFIYTNIYGTQEPFTAVLHYSAGCDDPEMLDEILEEGSKWFMSNLDWEDRNSLLVDMAANN